MKKKRSTERRRNSLKKGMATAVMIGGYGASTYLGVMACDGPASNPDVTQQEQTTQDILDVARQEVREMKPVPSDVTKDAAEVTPIPPDVTEDAADMKPVPPDVTEDAADMKPVPPDVTGDAAEVTATPEDVTDDQPYWVNLPADSMMDYGFFKREWIKG